MTDITESPRYVAPPKRSLVVGATSSLAQCICHVLARRGQTLVLAGRSQSELELLASDLTTRYGVETVPLVADLIDERFSPDLLLELAGDCDHVIFAAGDMGGSDPTDPENIAYTSLINFTIPAQVAAAAVRRMVVKKKGSVVVISSVAGDQVRSATFAYGSAKAGLSAFLSGLRLRFAREGVHIMTVKPGFIDTSMTWGMKSKLIVSRTYAAEKIVRAMEKKKTVLYVPFFWRWIMLVFAHIPEWVLRRIRF